MTTAAANQGAINLATAAHVVATLARGGVRDFVLSPGSRNTPVVLASLELAEREPSVRRTVMVDERSAAFFALGCARASGRPVALACTSGSAGANYHAALCEALESRVPLVAITADRPGELQGRRAPQTMEQPNLFGPSVSSSIACEAPSSIEDSGAAAARLETEIGWRTPAGSSPVHLNLPFREPLWTADDTDAWGAFDDLTLAERAVKNAPAGSSAEALATSLATPDGLIVVGPLDIARLTTAGVSLSDYRAAMLQLSDQTGRPILADPASQLRFDAADSRVVTGYDAFLRSGHARAALTPGAVLMVGEWPTSKPLKHALRDWPGVVTQLQLTDARVDPEHRVDRFIRMELDVLVGFAATLDDAREAQTDWLRRWRRADEAATKLARSLAESAPDTPLWEGAVLRQTATSIAPGDCIHLGSSMPIRDADAFAAMFGTQRPDSEAAPSRVFVSRGVNGIDGTIATAAGELYGERRRLELLGVDRDVAMTAVMGDLTFLHDAGSLAWVPRDARLRLVINDNSGGGIFHHLKISEHERAFESSFVTPPTVDIGDVARGFGARVTTVRTSGELHDALREEIRAGVSVIRCVIDRHDNVRLHKDHWQRVAEHFAANPISLGATALNATASHTTVEGNA